MKNDISPEVARNMLWEKGILHWLLKPVQLELYESYHNCKQKVVVWNCARRIGKSFSLCVIALETCLKKPNALVKYCCAKQKDAKGIIRPLIREIIISCPADLRPEYKTQDGAWVFPNGSRIELTGLDGGRAESVRGGSSDLSIIDEAGLVGDLPYIITSIILPTTATTKGKILLASTPPKSPAHPFITRYLNKAKIEGNLVTKTIYDNPNIDKEEFDKLIEESGGVNSIDFRREYLCEIIKDDRFDIIPEFTATVKANIIKEWKRQPFYDAYVSMDVGMKDLTVVLFAWYDFKEAKIIVEDEFVINGHKFNTSSLAEGIKKKETEVYTDSMTGEQKSPYMRVSDNNLILIKDLWELHGLRFFPTKKDDAEAALNQVRIMIQNERIIINPRCKALIHHLEAGVWNNAKTSFEQSADCGHYDAIDSLKYLVRNVQTSKNPYPAHYFQQSSPDTFRSPGSSPLAQSEYSKVMNVRSRSTTDQLYLKKISEILQNKK